MSKLELVFSNGTATGIHTGGNTNVLTNLPIMGKGKFYFEFTPSSQTLYSIVFFRFMGGSNHNSEIQKQRIADGLYTQHYNGIVRYILEATENIFNKNTVDFTLYHAFGESSAEFTTTSPWKDACARITAVNAQEYRICIGIADSSSPAGIKFSFNFGASGFHYAIPQGCKPINEGLYLTTHAHLYQKDNAVYGIRPAQ